MAASTNLRLVDLNSDTLISNLPEVGDTPNQLLSFLFPKCEYGRSIIVKCSFQSQWFSKWQWLHYDQSRDMAFCHTCMMAVKSKKITSLGTGDLAFVSRGYSNWKDATGEKGAFNTHQKSSTHKRAVEVVFTLPATTGNVGEMLSRAHAQERLANRDNLLKLFQNIQFLSRQGIALRGHDEQNSNFIQLLHLRSIDDSKILEYLASKTDKYTSHQVQNEMLQVMALRILREICDLIRGAAFYSIMADEVTNSSNREQVVVCLRWVDQHFEPHEEFVGLHMVDTVASDRITTVLKDILLRMNLNLSNCRGQCYDGASNMSGRRSGVAAQLSAEEPRAIYTHCYGHALNLAAGDTIKQNKLLCDALDITSEISKLLKYSPRRDSLFETLKKELAPDVPSFRTLCPTRWTVKASSLESVLNNYKVFQALWEEAKEIAPDSETRTRIAGVEFKMSTFPYLFGVLLGECVLKHTDNLSKTLQSSALTAAEAHHVANLTCQTLERIRDDKCYDLFWERALRLQNDLDVDEPELPRMRKPPRRYEIGSSESDFHSSAKNYSKVHCYEALDLIVNLIQQWFDQPGYGIYCSLQDLLIKAAHSEDFHLSLTL